MYRAAFGELFSLLGDTGARLKAYDKRGGAQRTVFGREVSTLLSLEKPLDCVAYLSELVGPDVAQRWSDAIRRVTIGEVAPESQHVRFAAEPLHPANTDTERRWFALLLLIQGNISIRRASDLRAWTRDLWRGRQHTFEVTDDGEWRRKYNQNGRRTGKGHHGGHQGGLAARLGVCVRTVDRYLAVAKAAKLLDVRQVKGEKVKQLADHLKSKAGHAYAWFRWLGELPAGVMARLSGRVRVPETVPARETPPPSRGAAAPAPADDAGAEWLDRVRSGAAGRSRPPG